MTVLVHVQRMRLADAVALIPDFDRWNHADKIKYFAWYLHTYRNMEHFTANDIRECFRELHIAAPASVNPFIGVMEKRSPKEAFKTAKGYRLDKRLRTALDARYGERHAKVRIPKSLLQLAAQLPDGVAVDEMLACFGHGAFLAVVELAWNEAYAHLARWILRDPKRSDTFNAQLNSAGTKRVRSLSDFSRLSEDEAIEAAAKARILSATMRNIMEKRLQQRNAFAFAPKSSIARSEAEAFVKELLGKIVLPLQ